MCCRRLPFAEESSPDHGRHGGKGSADEEGEVVTAGERAELARAAEAQAV
jgi:hypothetical protein